MSMFDRETLLDRILDSYAAYYDVERVGEGDLVATAEFHLRNERYLLTRSINMWSEEDHEYVYIYSGEYLDHTLLSEAISHSLEDGMDSIVPGKDHRCSSITTVLVYDGVDGLIQRAVRKYSYHKSFKLMMNGWAEHRVVLIDLSSGCITASRRGDDVSKTLRKIMEIE